MKKTILIIEDDFETQLVFTELLRAEGYDVLTVTNGREAEAVIEDGAKPALIFMDLNFPEGSPEELTKNLRAKEETSQIPIILVSGKENIAEYAHKLNASNFIKKPFEIDPLLKLVKSYI